MKRYLLFAGNVPTGGAGDLIGDFDTEQEAKASDKAEFYDWHHVLDTGVTMEEALDAIAEGV